MKEKQKSGMGRGVGQLPKPVADPKGLVGSRYVFEKKSCRSVSLLWIGSGCENVGSGSSLNNQIKSPSIIMLESNSYNWATHRLLYLKKRQGWFYEVELYFGFYWHSGIWTRFFFRGSDPGAGQLYPYIRNPDIPRGLRCMMAQVLNWILHHGLNNFWN